jgi:uroporphyrinogen-III synthase
MKKTVLLTRNIELNRFAESEVENLGFKPISCPLIQYEDKPINLDFSQYNFIIITSNYLARKIAQEQLLPKSAMLLVVGTSSRKILLDRGYNVVLHFEGSKDIHNYVQQELLGKKVLYLSGTIITQEMPYWVTKHIAYDAHYAKTFDKELISILKEGVNYILFYSVESALAFVELMTKYQLNVLKKSTLITIGYRVADAINKYFNGIILYSSMNEHKDMLDILVSYDQR